MNQFPVTRPFGANALIDQLSVEISSRVQTAVKDYANIYYEENKAVILVSVIGLITWVLWVSTRRTK